MLPCSFIRKEELYSLMDVIGITTHGCRAKTHRTVLSKSGIRRDSPAFDAAEEFVLPDVSILDNR